MKRIILLVAISIIGLTSAVNAGVISKTFEIGEGTSQPMSHRRTFEIPCNRDVSVFVSYSRLGRPGAENDVPIDITVMQPAADGGEGEGFAHRYVKANTNLNSVTFNGGKSLFGCGKTWSVRVKAGEGSSNFTVKGEIRLSFSDDSTNLKFLYGNSGQNIAKGESVDFDIFFNLRTDDSKANSQGIIVIQGSWLHNLGTMPINMKVELINPRGESVAQDTGYSQNEINPCCSGNKASLRYRIPEYIEGAWKVRLKNVSQHDSIYAKPIGTFKPSCP